MAKPTRRKKKSPPRPSPKRTPPPKPRAKKKAAKKKATSRSQRSPQPTARPRGQQPGRKPGKPEPKPQRPPAPSRKFHQRTLVVAAKTPKALQKAIDAAEEQTRHGVKVECVFQPKTGTPWFTLTFMESKR